MACCIEGEPVKLRCKVDGQPLPQVTWFFNDEQLPQQPDDRYSVICDYHEFILMMPHPTLDMSGRYTASASNQHGTKSTSTTLDVHGRSRPPGFYTARRLAATVA